MKELFYHLFSSKNQVKSISLFIVLILFYSAVTQAQSSNQFFNQNQFDPRTDFPLIILNGQAIPRQQAAVPLWENIQTIVVDQPAGPNIFAKPVSLNLDQVRNGSGTDPVVPPLPASWVNGNAGSSNAHYAEGWSIPYRCVFENLPSGAHSVDIEWDTRQSSSSAIDFVTNYDLLDYLPGSHVNNFGHVQEVINPIVESGTWNSGNASVIPTPDFTGAPAAVSAYYTAIMTYSNASGPANKFSIWNADITNMIYISQSSVTGSSGSSRVRIFFTNTLPTVVIAWGGHIAKGPGVWGDGNSAAAVSGSPYHTRLIEWDDDGAGPHIPTSVGNQDRSLSADAVLDPPTCSLGGPTTLECSATGTFSSGVASSDLGAGVTSEWSVQSTTCGTNSITLSNQSVGSVTASVSGCSCNFVLRFKLLKNGVELSHCDKPVTVTDTQAPTIICANPTSTTVSCPASATDQFVEPTATDACSTPTVTHTDATAPGSCAGNFTVTRKWTARDACGNTSTCSRSVTSQDITPPTITGVGGTTTTLGCNPSANDINAALGTATATDGCSTPTVTPTDGSVSSSSCSRSQTRTFTARDACGNTSTALRTVTWTADQTGPIITTGGTTLTLGCNPSAGDINAALGTATATDGCSTPTVTPSDGSISSSSCSRSQTRTFTARDFCGNTSTASRTVTWTADQTGPTITSGGTTLTLGCNPSASDINAALGTATATDGCSTPTVTPTDGSVSSSSCSRSQTRTFTARDFCGNTSTASRTVIWTFDQTAPAFTSCPAGSDLGCNPASVPGPGTPTATDNCGGTPGIGSVLGDPVNTGGCNWSRTRIYTATDGCSNTATCAQVFTYKIDNTAPVFVSCLPDITVECGDPTSTAALGSATASDGCGSTTVTANDGTPIQVGCQTVIVRTWTARDACGNTATCVQRILVIDTRAPVITCNSDGSASATDCGSYYLYQNGTKWTAIDASGNISTATCTPTLRIAPTQITAEQKEQTNTSVTEEKTKTAISVKPIVQNIIVQTIPNPFNDKVKFIVTAPEAGYATLDVMNMLGQKVKTVFQGRIPAGGQSFEMVLPKTRNTTLFYILRMNGKQVTGKLVQMN